MKKILLTGLFSLVLSMTGCTESSNRPDKIVFATSATYPPFEYREYGEFKGFDIDLAKKIAEHLGKKAEFRDLQFSAVLPSLQTNQADAAIATITITDARKKKFDFSNPYYFEVLAVIFPKEKPIKTASELAGKKVGYQLGTVMEFWLKQHAPSAKLVAMDDNNQTIEALKAGHLDAVLLDGTQGYIFSQKKPGLSYRLIGQAKEGYGIVLKKGSPLLKEINKALQALKENGEIEKLQKKWLKTNQP